MSGSPAPDMGGLSSRVRLSGSLSIGPPMLVAFSDVRSAGYDRGRVGVPHRCAAILIRMPRPCRRTLITPSRRCRPTPFGECGSLDSPQFRAPRADPPDPPDLLVQSPARVAAPAVRELARRARALSLAPVRKAPSEAQRWPAEELSAVAPESIDSTHQDRERRHMPVAHLSSRTSVPRRPQTRR
jgi:hypothetical protein